MTGIELAQPVDQVKVTIMDRAGIPVRHLDLGAHPSGVSTIPWDGQTDSGAKAADGNYTFSVNAKQNGNEITANTLSLGLVNSVSSGENGALLDMGELGLVNLSDTKRVF